MLKLYIHLRREKKPKEEETKLELQLQSIQNLIIPGTYTIDLIFFLIQSNAAPAKGASRNPNQPRIDALPVINMAAPTEFSTPLALSKAIEANRAVNLRVGIDPIGESELEELFEVRGENPDEESRNWK